MCFHTKSERPCRTKDIRLGLPPSEVPQHHSLHNPPRQRSWELDVGIRAGSPKRDHAETVTYRATEGYSSTFFIEVLDEIQSELLGSELELLASFGILFAG